ncbi:MAG: bifunctional (p)ppGpp synthetase/guanosine-3',5'-bis(diphosphate) 3'-pyrophosphohydrolase [Deltaproteobacteria bacterium]|nr:bifunctional (p)ppGpp synthetase/guanosine-3',5'-bis(diphosphate) 3'-pyrophosphohydrolase [Deltaproteobacteria bacterium]
MTQTQHKPSKDWLKFAVSSRAKSRIRSFIRQEQRDRSVAIGKELIEKEFEKLTLAPSKYLKKEFIDPLLEEMGFQSFDTLAMRVGYGRINPVTVVSRLVPKNILDEIQKAAPPTQSNDNIISRIFKKVKERRRSIVKVGGYDDIMVTLGRCCAPLPGDSIVGFITRGRGVTVHNLDCTKAMEMDPERKVEVVWDEKNEIAHHAKLKVVSADRPGLLASMTKVISNDGVNISQASIRTTGDQKAINIFEVEIKNTEQLKGVMRALERLGGIINVERIRG